MGWQRRGRRDFYYRCERRGDRVRRVYFGNGVEASVAAALDAERRARAEAERQERAKWDAVDKVVGEACGLSDLVAELALVTAGFHRHAGGEWRRRRD